MLLPLYHTRMRSNQHKPVPATSAHGNAVVRRPWLTTTAQRGAREADRFTIYGERCSGTKWLTVLLEGNLGLPVTWEFGWKHFFGGTQKLPGRDATGSTLFVCVVRDPVDWVNSLYRMPHHLTGPQVRGGVDAFMTEPVESRASPRRTDGRAWPTRASCRCATGNATT